MKLEGRKAVVTGASRGIGRAIAIALADEGADVVVNYASSEAAAQAVVREIEKRGRKSLAIRADVSDFPDTFRMAQEVLASFAQSLAPSVSQASRRRQPGALAPTGEPSAVRVVRRPYMRALLRLLAEAKTSDQPMSARRWRHERAPELPILDGLWIEVVLDYVAKGSGAARGLPYRIIAEGSLAAFSGGNLRVLDIEVGACKSA